MGQGLPRSAINVCQPWRQNKVLILFHYFQSWLVSGDYHTIQSLHKVHSNPTKNWREKTEEENKRARKVEVGHLDFHKLKFWPFLQNEHKKCHLYVLVLFKTWTAPGLWIRMVVILRKLLISRDNLLIKLGFEGGCEVRYVLNLVLSVCSS